MPNLEAIRGDTNIYNIVVLRGDVTINITGAKIWFTAKHFPQDTDANAVIRLDSNGNGVNIYDALHGRAQISVPPESTTGLADEEVLFYDVQMKESNGIITTIATGKMHVQQDVTQAVA
jgi:hypothetical protein